MLANNRIKIIRSLRHKKYRYKEKLFLAEGTKITHEAILNSQQLIENIYCTSAWEISNKLPLTVKNKIITVSQSEIGKISNLNTPQEVIMVLKLIREDIRDISIGKINLVLDDIRDPGNLGTIIRLADWFGIRNIICSNECVDLYNPKVVQASMGSLFRVNTYYTDLYSFLKSHKKAGENTIYGTGVKGQNIYKEKLHSPAFIVIGSESHGLSKNIEQLLDIQLSIPSHPGSADMTDSLNAGVATGIICGEFFRRFTQNGN